MIQPRGGRAPARHADLVARSGGYGSPDPQVNFVISDSIKIIFLYFTLLVVVILTALALVAVALGIARAISPRSYNPQKGEAYECGIPTRGRSWMQFKVGYYLFAILFLMFDVETVFLFSWAVVVQDLGLYGLTSIVFFLVILVLGLAYAWRKGALEWK